MGEFSIQHLFSGGLITNYFCTSHCGHCLYNCGPHREKDYIGPETAEENFAIIRNLGCRSVHIGGGEPMLRPDELCGVLETALKTGMSIEYVETNSSWYTDAESAERLLLKLKKKGLRTLLVSISPFHNAHIPYAKVDGVMAACASAGINIFPWIQDFISDMASMDVTKKHDMAAFRQAFGDGYLNTIRQRYWVHMGGRALQTFRPIMGTTAPEIILSENPDGCARALSDTSHFHIDLFGNYIPGLCSGLAIYRDDLGKTLSDRRYPVMTTLADSGINGLYTMAKTELGYSPARSGYINKCDMCTEIRAFMVNNNFGLSELQPAAFYACDEGCR